MVKRIVYTYSPNNTCFFAEECLMSVYPAEGGSVRLAGALQLSVTDKFIKIEAAYRKTLTFMRASFDTFLPTDPLNNSDVRGTFKSPTYFRLPFVVTFEPF